MISGGLHDTTFVADWRRQREQEGRPTDRAVIAVVSDIHGSLSGLVAVLRSAYERGVTEVWCLGDVVGRGPFPSECVALLGSLGSQLLPVWLMGNHECVVLESDCCPAWRVNNDNMHILSQHRNQLHGVLKRGHKCTYADWQWLETCVRRPIVDGPVVYGAHGGAPTAYDTVATRYTTGASEAEDLRVYAKEATDALHLSPSQVIVVGHTHEPASFWFQSEYPYPIKRSLVFGQMLPVDQSSVVLNVGSAGGWVRGYSGIGATYGIVQITREATAYELVAVPIDVGPELAQMRATGYPESFIQELESSMGINT